MKAWEDWPEGVALIVLVIGFVLSLLTRNSLLNYLIVFFAGAIFGNLYYKQRHRWKFESVFIGVGFLIGFVLGNFYENLGKVLILFGVGAWGAYYLHVKKYIVTK